LAVYGIDLPMIKPWSSRPSIIDTVLNLFDLTSKCVESTPESRTHARDKEPLSQLPPLAGVLFECIKERLDWLSRYMIQVSSPSLSDHSMHQLRK
jgi:nuclear pore complex protein Nup133